MNSATATAINPAEATTTATGLPQIAVLDRGFVYVGHCSIDAGILTITNALCIRRWGTSRGLGELALEGPKDNTKLDRTGTLRAPVHAVVHLIDTAPGVWHKHLADA